MTTAQIRMPAKLVPVFMGNVRYRGAYGGRGSGKTRTFAKMTAVRAYELSAAGESGVILCGREFMNSLDESSMAEIKEAITDEPWLAAHFDIGEKYIRTKDGRIRYAFVGLHENLNSIKSKARIHLAWVDEAETVSEKAWGKLTPTVREEGSELWITWNPEQAKSATHKRFRENPPNSSKIIEMNWQDNPFFPDVLNQERLEDQEKRPDSYDHIWQGGFVSVVEGAYFAKQLAAAKADNRIGLVRADPLMTLRAVWDIGGTGAKADATSIWLVQYVGSELRFLDYYEAVGQPLATHVAWLRENGYERALCVLPHDGAQHDKIRQTTYEGALREAGFTVEVVPNQGAGAAMQRIEAARRLFPQMRFDSEKCAGGLDALGWYHEKRDEARGIGLGPDHDWSSHAADAFGLAAVTFRPPVAQTRIDYSQLRRGIV